MATAVSAAYPYVQVNIDTSGLQPVAQRSPGVIAIVGSSANAAGNRMGSASVNEPLEVDTLGDATSLFGTDPASGSPSPTLLSQSLLLALEQDPRPSKIYGVAAAVAGGTIDYGPALSALEGVDDVTFVGLANEVAIGKASAAGAAATDLLALKEHIEGMSASGSKRIGVAMVDPTIAKTPEYVTTVTTAVGSLQSSVSRMVLVAARGAVDQNNKPIDTASAAMAAIAGWDPQVSIVLKRIEEITVPPAASFSPSEIKGLSEAGINPVVSPSLIVGGGSYFGDGRTYTTDATMLFVDIVRVLDQIDYELRAGLIGTIGDARITKSGMTQVKARTERILGPLQSTAVIDNFEIDIPVLDVLSVPESTWTPAQQALVTTARANRTVDMTVAITYGPAVHRLLVKLTPQF
jgi:hypothetical protein